MFSKQGLAWGIGAAAVAIWLTLALISKQDARHDVFQAEVRARQAAFDQRFGKAFGTETAEQERLAADAAKAREELAAARIKAKRLADQADRELDTVRAKVGMHDEVPPAPPPPGDADAAVAEILR